MVLPTRGQRDWDDELNAEFQRLDGDVQSAKADATTAKSTAISAQNNAAAAANSAAQSATAAQVAADGANRPTADAMDAVLADPASAAAQRLAGKYVASQTPSAHAPALGAFFPEAEGAVGDGVADDAAAINAAASAARANPGAGVVYLTADSYGVGSTIELSGSSTAQARRSTTLVGPSKITALATFSGDVVVRHTQTPAQAAATPGASFGFGAGLRHVEIDGTNLPAGTVHGLRLDGTWQPVLDHVYVHDMTGHGWVMPADNSIDAVGDDSYGNIAPVVVGCKFTANGGWGIYQSRFAAAFTAQGCYVNDNESGGVRITAPTVVWTGGAIHKNGGVGLHFTRSESAINSQLSNATFTSVEIDRNAGSNVWFEHAYNCTLDRCRITTAETGAAFDGGVYVSPTLVKFGGTAGMSAFNIELRQPYVRSSQQTSNPPLTLFDFQAQATDCKVTGMYELAGYSTARTVGNRAGQRNFVTSHTGETVFGDSVAMTGAYVEATLTNPTTVSTALTDLVFNNETSDATSRYDPGTGIYSFREDNGVFLISGYVTVDGAAATSNRLVAIHLRFDSGSGSFSSAKVINASVAGTGFSQVIPFQFTLAPATANARIKLATAASTGTALLVGAQYSNLTVARIA